MSTKSCIIANELLNACSEVHNVDSKGMTLTLQQCAFMDNSQAMLFGIGGEVSSK